MSVSSVTGAKAQVPYGPERETVLEAARRVDVDADDRHEKVELAQPACLAKARYAAEGAGSL